MVNYDRFLFNVIVHDIALKVIADENIPCDPLGMLLRLPQAKEHEQYSKLLCFYIEELTKKLERLNLVDYCFEVYKNEDIQDKTKVIMTRMYDYEQ